MRKRIIHIITELDVGGTEKQLLLMLPELQRTHDQEIICLMGRGEIGKRLEKKGIPVHYIDGTSNADVRILLRLWKLLRNRKPDVVITYLIYADIVGRITAAFAGIKIVIESHRSALFGSAWWHQVDRFTRFLVSHYVCQTEATKQLLHQTPRIPLHSITVIPNAVQVGSGSSHSSIREELHIPSTDIVIACVANLKPEKDIPLLLESFESLYSSHTTIHLLLVGEGPKRNALLNQIERYSSKRNIHVLGLRNDVPQILSESDIFVLPTQIEGMSNALLEALAIGIPCITTDIPANKELISPNQTGILFPVGNMQALLKALKNLIDNPTYRRELCAAGKEYVQLHHGISTVTQKWNSLIQTLLTT